MFWRLIMVKSYSILSHYAEWHYKSTVYHHAKIHQEKPHETILNTDLNVRHMSKKPMLGHQSNLNP